MRVQHGRAVLLERVANPEQRRDAHAVDGEHLDVDALLLRERPDRSVLSEPDDAGVDAAGAATRREVHDELLQAAQPQPVDQVGDADAHAPKVGTALAGGYAAWRRIASMATPPRISASAPTARGATLSPATAAPRPTATTGLT